MSTATNKGSQDLFFQYGDPITGAEFDAKEFRVSSLGIYDGALLSTVDNSTVEVSAWTAVIGDGTYVTTGRATSIYDVTGVSSVARNIVLRWFYATQNNWYIDILAVSDANIQTWDLVIGRVVYSGGGVIIGYDYTTRNDCSVLMNFLAIQPSTPASMKVLVRAGACSYGNSKLLVPIQLSPSLTAPVSNSRIDLVYVDTSGAIQIQQGVEAVTPSAPSYAGKIVLAEVTLTVGIGSIVASNIKDVRPFLSGVSNANFMDLTTAQSTSGGVKSFQGGIAIEVRTSDPGSPVNGQIWLRSDL